MQEQDAGAGRLRTLELVLDFSMSNGKLWKMRNEKWKIENENCGIQVGLSISVHCPLPTAHCPLLLSFRLLPECFHLIKRGGVKGLTSFAKFSLDKCEAMPKLAIG
jgi:hypothetical protein